MKISALKMFANMAVMVLLPALAGCLQMAETCNGEAFNDNTEFCREDRIYSKCSGKVYDPEKEFCDCSQFTGCGEYSDGRIYSKCGGNEYYPSTQRCEGGVVEFECGNKWYAASNTNLRCEYNVIKNQCGTSNWYNSLTEFCFNSIVYNKCDGEDYNPSTQRCENNVIEIKCGTSNWYNSLTEFCFNGIVYNKCDGEDYNPSTEFCSGTEIYAKCGGTITFSPSTESCCGSNKYTISNQRCESSVIETKCGSSWYDPSTEYCSNGTVKDYGSVTYEDKSYKTVVIGEQTWMAENLNYAASGSVCYNNQDSNCDTYGRLYNWATAMALSSNCNSAYCSSQIGTKYRGICPSGWHIPSDAEWSTLTDNAGSSVAGTKLKAASGWNNNGNGTDDYGFSALPGGYGNSYGYFDGVGNYGRWWSSTENSYSGAYYRHMNYDIASVIRYDDGGKSHYLSVRCVQD